jgi:AraC family transcriptional regulator
MTPGSVLLGSAGQSFKCSHEHAIGDRCIAFEYEPEYFECLAEEAGVKPNNSYLPLRVPPVSELSTLVARTSAGLSESCKTLRRKRYDLMDAEELKRSSQENAKCLKHEMSEWEAIMLEFAVKVLAIAGGLKSKPRSLPSAEARTTRVIRMIDNQPDEDHNLVSLAREAKLSRYHFLRVFQELTGLTPHQYVLRARLRRAATRLISEPSPVIAVALESGFGDLSNFTRAFRREFGVSPKTYRNARA